MVVNNFNLHNDFGIVPYNGVPRFKNVNFNKLPIKLGIVPFKLNSKKSKCVKDIKYCMEVSYNLCLCYYWYYL